jgi:soluble lytic murein transglycosylase
MVRFAFKLILCVLMALGATYAYFAVRSGDPVYTFFEWISPARFQQYNKLIGSVASEYHVDPMLLKAVIWRESRFEPRKYGTAGERGLMQVRGKAADEWARERKIDNFQADQLFDPRTNLEAGAWYLRRALDHWENQSNPVPFALAEYNAGASRAQRWAGGNETGAVSTSDFLAQIDFPATRKYVDTIIERYQFYKRRGRM